MGFFDFLKGKRRSDEYDRGPASDFWYQALSDLRRPAGQVVNATTASRVAAVFACHSAIKESISMLPATVMESEDEFTKVARKDHYLYSLLRDQPNPWMDSFEFFEAMQTWALDEGNAYARLERKKSGAIFRITPLDATRMDIRMSDANELAYEYRNPVRGQTEKYTPEDIFHFKPHTKDGLNGRTPIRVAADSVGYALALLAHGNRIFENGAFHSGFVQAPHAFKDQEARDNFLKSLKASLGKQFALLEQGVVFKEGSMNNRDAQFLEAKEASALDIARIFRVPPVIIQIMDKGMSFASVEQINLMFVQYTIQPWATRWERAIQRQLLTLKGEEEFFLKFNLQVLLRGDLKTRTEAVVQRLQYGLLTINEARNLEDMNPIEDPIGDIPLVSHNLTPASKLTEEPKEDDQEPEKPRESPETPQEKSIPVVSEGRSGSFTPLLDDIFSKLKRKELRALGSGTFSLDEHRNSVKESLQLVCRAIRDNFEPKLEKFLNLYMVPREQLSPELLRLDDTKWSDELIKILEEYDYVKAA